MPKIESNQITFVDITDSRKLDVYISSNLPTTQIYNSNTGAYSPDWKKTNLSLNANVYLDSEEIIPETIQWSTKINGFETDVEPEFITDSGLLVSTNVLANSPIITYICRVSYDSMTAFQEITFMRADTGLNGSNGKDGTSVTILGSYSTLPELQTAHPIGNAGDAYIVDGDLYVWAVDDARWENVGNIQGPKGDQGESAKAIILNATAQVFKVDKDDVLSPATITVTAHTFNTTVTSWSYSADGGKTFLSTAPSGVSINQNIVTISGSSLTSDSLVIRASDGTYGDTITIYKVFDGYNGTPAPIAFLTNENITFGANENGQIKTTSFTTDVVAYIGTTKVLPTIGEIKNLPSGMTFKSSNALANTLTLTFDIANNSTFGSESSNRGTINIPIISPVNTNLILNWSKVNAGASGTDGEPGEDAYTVVLTNASHTFAGDVTNAIEGSASTEIIAYKGSEPQVVTIVSVNGMNASTNKTATGISGLSFQCSTLNDVSPTITFTCTSDFKNASGLIPIVLSVDGVTFTKMFTYSIAFKGEPGEVGPSGVGINSVTVTYGVSTSASTQPTAWQNSIPAVSDGSYLWTRTVTDYTDDSIPDTVTLTYARQGLKGDTGSQGSSITVSSVQYQAGTSATTAPTSTWSNSVVEVAEGSYLWTKTTFSDNKVAYGVARQGIDGEKGDTGKGVSSIVEQYYQSTSATAQSGGTWSTTVPTWADGKYIWTRSVITYTDSTTHTTSPVCVTGQKGGIGGTGIGVSSVDVWYYQSTSATSLSGGSWSTTAPTWSDGKYVWTKTIVTYTNSTTDETNAVCITGQKGSTGVGIKSVTEYYLATASSSGVTTSTSGWTTAIQTITSDKKYLWNYEVITYTDNTTSTTTPIVIGVFGNTGNTGKGIKSVTEYYLATSSSSGVTTSTSGWTTTMQSLTATNKYLWNYELITYTDNTTATINPVIIGAYGDKGNQGDKGVPAVTFQVYAPNGYLLTKDLTSLTLQTFAYEGSTSITSGATYQWAQYTEDAWENISGATSQTLTVTKNDVEKSKSYKCTMTYKSQQYTSTVTVQDKTDTYDSLLQVITRYSPTNRIYWVLYSAVYSEEGEIDTLLGSVSVTAPTSPTTGQYWYKIDETNYTVTLMKYSGTAWAETTDKQELVYDWSLLNDANKIMSLGSQSKVKIITSSDFSKTCTVQCNIRGSESIPISYSNQILIDPSDPIVSSAEPTNPTHGQLWIRMGANSLYTLLVWDASLEQWVVSETDSRVKVHISKPSSYEIGDVWVVGSDYEPTIYINGVAQTTKHLVGTMLKAQYSSQSYKDSDWVEALNYKNDINDLKENLNMYNQFFSADEDGLVMQAKDKNGVISEFKTKLTHTELGFYQGENKVAHINNNQLNISKAEITNGMTIKGDAPVLEIGNFIIIQESNGSLSIGSKI